MAKHLEQFKDGHATNPDAGLNLLSLFGEGKDSFGLSMLNQYNRTVKAPEAEIKSQETGKVAALNFDAGDIYKTAALVTPGDKAGSPSEDSKRKAWDNTIGKVLAA